MIKHLTAIDSYDTNAVELFIDLTERNIRVNGALVKSIVMHATEEFFGELNVNWESEADESYTHNTTLLMRDPDSEDRNTETMGQFYWENGFTAQLKAILIENGFSEEAVDGVTTTEWGMQEVGTATYDADELGEEMLEQFGFVAEEA